MADPKRRVNRELEMFYKELSEIGEKDGILTSKDQINRLLRPGASYFNLNPFEVLGADPDDDMDDLKEKYRLMVYLVHPDNNSDERERAGRALKAVEEAWRMLQNEETRSECLDIIHEARCRTEQLIKEKKLRQNKSPHLPDDKFLNISLHATTAKLFADNERKKRLLENSYLQMAKGEAKKPTKRKSRQELLEHVGDKRSHWMEFMKSRDSSKKSRIKMPKHRAEEKKGTCLKAQSLYSCSKTQ